MMRWHRALRVLPVMFLLAACDASNVTEPQTGQIKIFLVDSPADFDQVNVVVDRVEVHSASADSGSGWFVVNENAGTHDLLKLRNGVTGLLGDAALPAGHYTQIRLLVGSGSNVVVGGQPYSLTIPSGQQTGVKLNHPFVIEGGKLYELTLDFDADRSIKAMGGNRYTMVPVIRLQANVVSGTVSGVVQPVVAKPIVWTVAGIDTVSTKADPTSGAFKLMAMPEGTYTVRVAPAVTTFRDTTITGVVVTKRQDKNLGAITLSLK
ncbi:MAG: DUF4382 domain-containing protein [Ignavibacteria bacterium]|nr:DUF4382 domain-containing protein [Ignavibacteria bacterium]